VTFSEQIGRNLRKVRREAFMSQEDLSRRAGLHRSEVGLLERGLRVPRVDTCIKILESANADPRSLSEGIAWHEPVRFDEEGWFTIVGHDGPVDLRPVGCQNSIPAWC
jgi:transcriptional regulator with XRE-family HTH domain